MDSKPPKNLANPINSSLRSKLEESKRGEKNRKIIIINLNVKAQWLNTKIP